jgi:ankyrin repeat protein
MSNRERERYPPGEYFNTRELAVAEAIYHADRKQLAELIDRGTEINHVGKEGFTYLMYAIMIEHYDVVEFLLEKGADPNQLSPLMKHKGNKLREQKDWRPLRMLPLETCCGSGYPIKYLKLLIKYGAVLNDNRTELPLHVAILSDNIEKIKYLLDCGADINQLYRGSTPAMTAAKIMSWDMIDYLLDRGADVFQVDNDGYTLGLYLQEYIDRDAWTPAGRKRLEGLINRLKEKGVQFPVVRQKPGTEPVSQTIQPPPTTPPSAGTTNIRSEKKPPSKPHSWILDDDDWIIS